MNTNATLPILSYIIMCQLALDVVQFTFSAQRKGFVNLESS